MTNLKPASDYRKVAEVLQAVDTLNSLNKLMVNLQRAEHLAEEEGWIVAEQLEAELGVSI